MKESEEMEMTMKKAMKIFGGTLIIIIAISAFLGSWYIINPQQRGILITLGKADQVEKEPDFHWKVPIMQKVVKVDITTQKYETGASAASSDLQIVSTNIAVNYHLDENSVVRVYQEIGLSYETKVIQPAVQEIVKSATAKFTAEQLITRREEVKLLIDEGLRKRLQEKGIIVETTSLTDFDFSEQFNQAIEMKVTAEQEALTEKNRLAKIEFQAQQKIAEANGTATSDILKAQAEAKKKLLVAESEAKALELQKVQVTDKILELRRIEVQMKLAENWKGQVPTVQMSGSGIMPILDMKDLATVAANAN